MNQHKVLFQRIVSADGRSIAEARSEVITSDNAQAVSQQSIVVTLSAAGTVRSVSSCSSSASSAGATTELT
ncbi:hypothetical protein [Stenomitos frigidus]|uniref:Uncharacterized protein n=1 Tax=Stenomitos frigidus ULC18 TaxID=2107698 RepID=A0A2T1DT93_9CYAN|nr:hypothetical protein [Stenomitos frigidus]PSB23736.1 hypothetical protein C7B82_29840 [Stenomitos frigidus ULC18]